MSDHDLYYGDFERDGEDAVRNNIAAGRYNGQKFRLAEEWLRRLDSAKTEASQAEQIEIARSAKNAAWEAAEAARNANTIAKVAAAIAAMALIIAIASFALSIRG
jgi:hypothetical protein